MIKGIDIASMQKDPDFVKVATEKDFVISKVTEGTGYVNPYFKRSREECYKNNLLFGMYHFARPSYGNSAVNEAKYFLKYCGELNEGDVLCLDYEDNWNGDVVAWCKAWLDEVFKETGVRPLIYLNQSQTKSYNWKPVVDGGYGLWLAAYTDNPVFSYWSFMAIQQDSSMGKVPGIPVNTDTNIFFGDREAFKKYGYKKPGTPEPPTDPCVDCEKKLKDLTEDYIELKTAHDRLIEEDNKEDIENAEKLKSKQEMIDSMDGQIQRLTTANMTAAEQVKQLKEDKDELKKENAVIQPLREELEIKKANIKSQQETILRLTDIINGNIYLLPKKQLLKALLRIH